MMTTLNQATRIPLSKRNPERPLRILFCVNTPWTETLGVPRVSIELARHLEMLGHQCDKFSLEDSGIRPNKLTGPFTIARFQRRLLEHIRKRGHEYDVIQAEHNLLPFPRSAYRFNGILIAKSNGLMHFYRRFQHEIEPGLRRRAGERGTPHGNLLRWLGRRAMGDLRAVERSFETADQIHLLNRDELAFVRDKLGYGDKCVLVPNGLSDERAAALAASATPEQRAASNTVVFIGTWSLRKGKLEFPEIVRRVRAARPQTRFRLIGTFTDEPTVRAAFAPVDQEHVEVIPRFEPEQLPSLLADMKCGVFPSYIEGFPLGVLEMLTAGIPVVAWDVPGPREMLKQSELAPPGDVATTANRLLDWLSEDFRSLGICKDLDAFRWQSVAEKSFKACSSTATTQNLRASLISS